MNRLILILYFIFTIVWVCHGQMDTLKVNYIMPWTESCITIHRCEISVYLAADSITTLASKEVWYPMKCRLIDGAANNFRVIPNVGILYYGTDSCEIMFWGDSDSKASKVSEVTYGLFVNSSLVPGGSTSRFFPSAGKYVGYSINRKFIIQPSDTIKVKLMSDTDNNEFTVHQLNLTFKQSQ